ncbi:WD40 repeat-like protein [Ramicandelaber brevisporus]|nr:WD40 repeat-like protein [Ramicandelaber brevisporus]
MDSRGASWLQHHRSLWTIRVLAWGWTDHTDIHVAASDNLDAAWQEGGLASRDVGISGSLWRSRRRQHNPSSAARATPPGSMRFLNSKIGGYSLSSAPTNYFWIMANLCKAKRNHASDDRREKRSSPFSNVRREVRDLRGHTGTVRALGWDSEGRWLASGGGGNDKCVRLWYTERLQETSRPTAAAVLQGHTASIEQLCWAPSVVGGNGFVLASASKDKTVRLWDVRAATSSTTSSKSSSNNNGGNVIELTHENINIAWSSDGKLLAVGDVRDIIHIIDVRNSRKVLTTIECRQEINQLKWHPHVPNRLLLAAQSGAIRVVYDVLADIPHVSQSSSNTMSTSTTATSATAVAATASSMTATKSNGRRATTEEYLRGGHTANCYCVDVDSQGHVIVSGGHDGVICVWDQQHLMCLRTIDAHDSAIRTLSLSGSGGTMLYASSSSSSGSGSSSSQTVISGGGDFVASAGEDQRIAISRVDTGEVVDEIPTGTTVHAVAWHPKKPLLAIGRETQPSAASTTATASSSFGYGAGDFGGMNGSASTPVSGLAIFGL